MHTAWVINKTTIQLAAFQTAVALARCPGILYRHSGAGRLLVLLGRDGKDGGHASASKGKISEVMKKKILIGVGLLIVVLAIAVVGALYVYPKAQIANATHQAAPDFTLADGNGGTFTLSSQRGHRVVLYFYRGYW